ncbi:PIN domain-containing protein [Nonomuraea zeae]|uniref:Type II toxin-antitoxin system VapC family toxin n=1 Tax=Nonomuraea zeae TaxID=1642303 RepID=A0A5S4GB43_9ACTN|nr:type II toxin-antitoxin system VapC family toxin [Nonomuraea zeae]
MTGRSTWLPGKAKRRRQTRSTGNLEPDAYLAALAIEHGCEFVTCDRDFARFEGLRRRSPLN